MINEFYDLYAKTFAKPRFIRWNKFLYNISIRGLGILNYKTEELRGEFYWLKDYLSDIKKPFVIDVGANVGNYTKNILKINQDTEIIAIEPHPITFKKLQNNLQVDNVEVLNYAVGNIKGILELFDYINNDGSVHASLHKDVIKDLHNSEVISHRVKVVRLDDILDEKLKKIDLLKIDTEGNEYSVLLGAIELLQENKIKAIHFEFNEMNIISKTTFKDFWDLLSDKYNFYRILPYGNLLQIKNYSPINCEIFHYQNIVCIKKDLYNGAGGNPPKNTLFSKVENSSKIINKGELF